ncbi:MAG: acetolactate synthase small subunit [SAR202 cluster bacterium]|nr:acetolactate synthase small subunit [SAR202 cluster bacterium]|tara:strand:+ start:588 stop:1094 length:507 start_codon:yes stop_codon:yes gene_type:complete
MTTKNAKNIPTRTVTALVNDKPGVLNRITSMLRRRGFNIQSLAVGHSEIDHLSRLTVVVEGGDDIVEKITKQLHKLIDIIKVNDISDDNTISRELALMKISSNTKTRSEIMQIVAIYRAKIVDVSPSSIIIEATGDDQKIKALQDLLSSFGIIEVMRTGLIAMNREKK